MKYSGEQVLILLAVVPNTVAALLAVFTWRRLPTKLHPLAVLTLFALFTEVFCRILWLFRIANLFVLPLYISIEFGLLVWLYSQIVGSLWLCRLRWPLVIGLGLLANLERPLRLSQHLILDNVARLIESVLVILLTLTYYNASLRRPNTALIWREPMFWVSTGLLFFFAGNFLIYTFTYFVFYHHRSLVVHIWVVHAGLNGLLYSTYAYALWLSLKN